MIISIFLRLNYVLYLPTEEELKEELERERHIAELRMSQNK
jgi:hypothetical protein